MSGSSITSAKVGQVMPKSVLIVDGDPASKAACVKLVSEMGIQQVESADTSAEAWSALRLHKFDLVLLEWTLSAASGAAVLHRVRANAATQDIPVLVMSGSLAKKDFIFGEEYLFTDFVKSPLKAAIVVTKIKDLIKERVWFAGIFGELEAMITAADDFNSSSVASIVDRIKVAPRPVPIGYAAARALIGRGQVESARLVLECILEKDGRSALALTMMGKCLLLQRNFNEAKKFFVQAHDFFPKNSERLVLMGDADMNLLDFESAKDNFNEALSVDPENTRAIAGVALAVCTEKYFSQVEVTRAPSLPSLLNSIGIGMVRTLKYEEGFQYYQNSLNYLEDLPIKGRVAFNLGLGYLRAHRPDEALPWFHKSDEFSNGLFQKPRDYIMKLTNGVALLASPGVHEEEQDVFALDSVDSSTEPGSFVPAKAPEWGPMKADESGGAEPLDQADHNQNKKTA